MNDDWELDDMPVMILRKLYEEDRIATEVRAGHLVGFIFEEDV